MGGGGSGQGRRHEVAAGGSAWGAPRAAWGCAGWSRGRGPRGWGIGAGGAHVGLLRGLARGRARRGREEGEAWSAVLYGGSLTIPRAKAAGTRGRGVPGDGAWHWDVRAPDTVSTPPNGSARALSSGASHPAPSP